MLQVLLVGLGGFIGASLRYLISSCFVKLFGNGFPYGTLFVNVTGAVLIGLIFQLSVQSTSISPDMKLFLTTGILGGLTTFSTFSNETMAFFTAGNYLHGVLNIFLNLGLSLFGVVIGKMLIK